MPYAQHPVTVDGVSLDSVAWNIESKIRTWAGSRSGDYPVPGVDGEAASLNDDLDSTVMTLSMWLLGTDGNGVVPGGSTPMAQCYANLDALSHLFIGPRHRLLDVREVVDASGTVRQAYCKVVDAIPPEVRPGGRAAFTVTLKLPDGLRQDVNTSDWAQASAASGTVYEVATLQGSTGPINDAVLLVTGPATNPTVTDPTTGAYVRLNASLTAGQAWRVNNETWSSRYGTLTLASPDASGTDASGITDDGGGNTRLLRLLPTLDTGQRRVRVVLSGTGFTAATGLSIRARRKFFQ